VSKNISTPCESGGDNQTQIMAMHSHAIGELYNAAINNLMLRLVMYLATTPISQIDQLNDVILICSCKDKTNHGHSSYSTVVTLASIRIKKSTEITSITTAHSHVGCKNMKCVETDWL